MSEPPEKKRKTASKSEAAKSVTSEDTDRGHGDEEESNDLAIKTAFLIKSKLSEIQSSQRTQHQHKQNRYSLYRSLDSSIVLKYPVIAITIKAIYKSTF